MAEETSRLNVEVDGTSAEAQIGRIQAAFERLQNAVNRTGQAFSRLGSVTSGTFNRMRAVAAGTFRMMQAGFRGLQRAARAFASTFRTLLKVIVIGGATFTAFARSVAGAGNQVNKFINTLVILKGDTAAASEELGALFDLSQKLGTSFTAAAQPFTKFAAAAAGALSDQAIRDVFESFATVGVALQLGQSEVTGVFLALQQIASKGVVSMEELRLQLAERVPGAMRLAASSMNMTMQEFEKAVTARTLNAGEFLERFAEKLKEVYGDAALLASQRLFADIQRLGNTLLKFRQEIFASGFERGLQNLVQSAINFLNNNPELARALGRFSEAIFGQVARFLDSLTADKVISVLNQLISAFESLINSIRELVFVVSKLFNEDVKGILSTIGAQTRAINGLVNQRSQAMADLSRMLREPLQTTSAGLAAVGIDLSEKDKAYAMRLEQRRQEEGIERQIDLIRRLNDEIDIQKQALVGLRLEANNLGVAFEALPGVILNPLEGTMAGPQAIQIPRIEPLPPGDGGLNLSNQPLMDFGATATIQDALEQAELFADMEMPEFYDKLVAGELRRAMEDLTRVQMDLNVINESQSMLMDEILRKEQEFNELRALGDTISYDQSVELNKQRAKLIELTQKYIEQEEKRIALKEELLKLMDEEDRKNSQFKTFQEDLEETFTSTRDVFINMIKASEDAITDFIVNGEASFKDFADEIIRQLVRMAVQAFITRFVLGPILGPISDAIGQGLGGPFAAGTPTASPVGIGHEGGVFHSGGIVEPRPSAFDMLRSNERAIIVQTGEGVFTKDQMANMASLSDISSVVGTNMTSPVVNAPTVNVNAAPTKVEVINQSGAEANVESTQQADGTELIRVVIGAVASDLSSDGQIAQVMKGKFGLRNRTNLR